MRYRRANAAGGTYFFTVNPAERRSDVWVRHIDGLHAAMKTVKDVHPFAILAMVALPEHLHAIGRLPPGDANYPLRWSLIKAGFSRRLAKGEHIRASPICQDTFRRSYNLSQTRSKIVGLQASYRKVRSHL